MDALNAFIILLERSEQRKTHVSNVLIPQLNSTNTNVIIQKAVDGKNDNLHEICEQLGVTVDSDNLLLGQVGCSLSHIKVWNNITERDLKYALVLEDDAIVNNQSTFASTINSILNELPVDWEVVLLYIMISQRQKGIDVQIPETVHLDKPYFTWGTTGYLVSNAGAKKLLADHWTIRLPVDDQMQAMDKSRFFNSRTQVISSVGQHGDMFKCVLHSNITGGVHKFVREMK